MVCCYSSNYQFDGEMSDIDPDHFMFVLHPGGGIPYDFGGYYLHNIINLLGSVKRVGGFCKTMYPDRIYRNPGIPIIKNRYMWRPPPPSRARWNLKTAFTAP